MKFAPSRRPILALACAASLASIPACAAPPGHDPPAADEKAEEARSAVITVDEDVLRFLEQATMGVTVAEYNALGSPAGFNAWIDKQMNAAQTPRSVYGPTADVRDQFFSFALNNPDQLRQRVALALSEIFVVSRIKLPSDEWIIPYLNMLSENAFGDFSTVLRNVAESAAMGRYLDNANNFVSSYDASTATLSHVAPNENFARELLQLFTVGLCTLNANGSLNGGVCTPPYSQEDVESFAHAMTGWTYDNGGCPNQVGRRRGVQGLDLTKPLIACDNAADVNGQHYTNHDFDAHPLLRGFATVAGAPGGEWSTRGAMEHLQSGAAAGTLDNLVQHPNTPAFIVKQLIQHLTTSNPGNDYVGRVADVFRNDGTGKRGNLGAVIKAILLDPDARTLTPGSKFGHLREPVLYVTGAVRMFGASPDGLGLRKQTAAMGQDIHYSPSVFNYFPPSFPLPGATDGALGPEFGVADTSTVVNRANFADALVNNPKSIAKSLTVDLSGLPTTSDGILDWLDAYAMHGRMQTKMREVISLAIAGQDADEMRRRAVYLVLSSSQYQVMR